MGNNPVGKNLNTPKGKYLGKYLFMQIPRYLPFYVNAQAA